MPGKSRKGKRVLATNMETGLMEELSSLAGARVFLLNQGCGYPSVKGIREACNGMRSCYRGYYWSFIE